MENNFKTYICIIITNGHANGNINGKLSTHGDHDMLAYHAADQTGISVFQKGRNFLVLELYFTSN